MSKYITVEEIESRIGREFDEETIPTKSQVEGYIASAEAGFDVVFGDRSPSTITDEVVTGLGTTLYVRNTPVIEVISVERNTGDLFNPEWTVTEFALEDASIGKIIVREGGLTRANGFRVSYEKGHTVIPMTIKDYVFLLVMRESFLNDFLRLGGDEGGKQVIVDADVYRSITGGGNPYKGIVALNELINEKAGLIPKIFTGKGVLI